MTAALGVPVLLVDAAALILTQGLAKDDWYELVVGGDGEPLAPQDGPLCAMGAINVAAGFDPDDPLDGERRCAVAVLAQHVGVWDEVMFSNTDALEEAVGGWNDSSFRTAEQVVAAFEGAAKAERALQRAGRVVADLCGEAS